MNAGSLGTALFAGYASLPGEGAIDRPNRIALIESSKHNRFLRASACQRILHICYNE